MTSEGNQPAPSVVAAPSSTFVQCVAMIAALTSITLSFGQWLGYSILESDEFSQYVVLKGETISDVKLIIVMSRHTIFMKDKSIFVVPTGDISRFKTAAQH